MKRFVSYLVLMVVAVFAWSCMRELPGGEGSGVVYASVDAGVKGDDGTETRSVINIDAENFNKAILFAFNPSTGKILTYGAEAGQAAGQPIIMQTTSQSFSWVLPLQTAIDFYVLANYGDLNVQTLLNKGANLKKSDLDGLVFTCDNVADLRALNESGYGIPMAGKLSIDASTIMTGAESLTFKVKRLFAKFTFSLDASYFTNQGANVEVIHIYSRNVNTEVPYFTEGFKQTSANKLVMLDHGTVNDLAQLNLMNSSSSISLYFPENCQGNKSGAAHWYDVAEVGSAMSPGGISLCSYIDLLVRVTESNGLVRNINYLIYLGTDCRTNFDVERNKVNSLHLNLANYNVAFEFTEHTKNFAAGEYVTLNYQTSLDEEEIAFSFKGEDSGTDFTNYFERTDMSATSATFWIRPELDGVDEDFICRGGRIESEDDSVYDECELVENSATSVLPYTVVQKSEYLHGWTIIDLPKTATHPVSVSWGYYDSGGSYHQVGNARVAGNSDWKDLGSHGKYYQASQHRLYLVSSYKNACLRLSADDDNDNTVIKDIPMYQKDVRLVPVKPAFSWYLKNSDTDTHVDIVLKDNGQQNDFSVVVIDAETSVLDPMPYVNMNLFQIPVFARRSGYEYIERIYGVAESDYELDDKVDCEVVDEDDGGGTLGYVVSYGNNVTSSSDDIWYTVETPLSPYCLTVHFTVESATRVLDLRQAAGGTNSVSEMRKSNVNADGESFYLMNGFMQSYFVEHIGPSYSMTVSSNSVSGYLAYQKTTVSSTVDRYDFWMTGNIPITDDTEPPYGYAGDESDFNPITITFKNADNTITRHLYCKLLNKRFSYRIGYNGYQMESAPSRTVLGRYPEVNMLRNDGDSFLRFNMWNPLRFVFDFNVNGQANGFIEYKPSVSGSTTSRTVENYFSVPITAREPKSETQGGCALEEVRSGVWGGVTSSVVNCMDVIRTSCENHHNYVGFPSGGTANYASHWQRGAIPYDVFISCSFTMDTFRSNQPGLSYRGTFNSSTIFKYITPYNYCGTGTVSPIGDFKYVYYDYGFYTHDWIEWGDRERVAGVTDGDHVLTFGYNQNSSARPLSPTWQFDKQVLRLRINNADSWTTMVTAIGN